MSQLISEYIIKPKLRDLDEFLEVAKEFDSCDIMVTPSLGFKTKKRFGPGLILNHSNPYIKFSAFEREGNYRLRELRYREIYGDVDFNEDDRFNLIPTLRDRLLVLEDVLGDSNTPLIMNGKNINENLDLNPRGDALSISGMIYKIDNFSYGGLSEFEDYSIKSSLLVRTFN